MVDESAGGCTGRCRPRDYVQAAGTTVRESARSLVCQDCRDSAKPCRSCFDATVGVVVVDVDGGYDGDDDDDVGVAVDCEGMSDSDGGGG